MDVDQSCKRNVHLILVQYYCSVEQIKNLVQDLEEEISFHSKVVINNSEEDFDIDNVNVAKGTNKLMDMSGYYEGLNYLRKKNKTRENDIYLFANDSIYRKHSVYWLAKSAKKLITSSNLPNGFYAGVPSEIKEKDIFQKYYSTYFFIVDQISISIFIKNFKKIFLSNRSAITKLMKILPLENWRPRIS